MRPGQVKREAKKTNELRDVKFHLSAPTTVGLPCTLVAHYTTLRAPPKYCRVVWGPRQWYL